MSGVGGAGGSGDPAGGAGGSGDPAAGTGGAGDPAADVERLKAALEAERNAHTATRQQLGELKNTQQTGGNAVTAPNTNQGQENTGTPVDFSAALQQIQALTERLNQQELENSRTKVAAKFGLTDAQASRLVGKTATELEADAKQLAEDFGIKVPGAEGGGGGAGADGAGAGDGAGADSAGAANEGKGAANGSAGTGATRRTTSTLRPGAANEGDGDRVTSQSDADKIAERVLGGLY